MMVARRHSAAMFLDLLLKRGVFAFTSPIACANARASTPVSPRASTGMAALPLLATP